MSLGQPNSRTYSARAAAVAGGSDAAIAIIVAASAGAVTDVEYVPDAAITGAATNNRTLSLVNKGQDGTGTTVMASLNFAGGTNAAANDERAVTLSVVAGATNVAAGDVLAFLSTHIGTGIADPGGLVKVTVSGAATSA